ncbi:hypothetical protein SAMN04488107_0083 [Geodermatophilus saharensis]|uniref:Uncharacterized protein n=1 Tax=Geodermatophilus saharensis TaxID=1137994 RepID=A0A238ZI13_9ACTN|nr:hypothetical protein [Geodermatophilus saharensis]SNR82681.1 hypothetical protein SAMN04488107_0083 [Geodermatophilus saharensis]
MGDRLWRLTPDRVDWHRNDCEERGVHLRRLPDRTLVPADRYEEELAAYEAARATGAAGPDGEAGTPEG